MGRRSAGDESAEMTTWPIERYIGSEGDGAIVVSDERYLELTFGEAIDNFSPVPDEIVDLMLMILDHFQADREELATNPGNPRIDDFESRLEVQSTGLSWNGTLDLHQGSRMVFQRVQPVPVTTGRRSGGLLRLTNGGQGDDFYGRFTLQRIEPDGTANVREFFLLRRQVELEDRDILGNPMFAVPLSPSRAARFVAFLLDRHQGTELFYTHRDLAGRRLVHHGSEWNRP